MTWRLFVVVALTALAGVPFEGAKAETGKKSPRVVYPKRTELDFEGIGIQGEVRNPGELYFQRRPEEKFDSLVKVRRNFHPEVVRDILQTR